MRLEQGESGQDPCLSRGPERPQKNRHPTPAWGSARWRPAQSPARPHQAQGQGGHLGPHPPGSLLGGGQGMNLDLDEPTEATATAQPEASARWPCPSTSSAGDRRPPGRVLTTTPPQDSCKDKGRLKVAPVPPDTENRNPRDSDSFLLTEHACGGSRHLPATFQPPSQNSWEGTGRPSSPAQRWRLRVGTSLGAGQTLLPSLASAPLEPRERGQVTRTRGHILPSGWDEAPGAFDSPSSLWPEGRRAWPRAPQAL